MRARGLPREDHSRQCVRSPYGARPMLVLMVVRMIVVVIVIVIV